MQIDEQTLWKGLVGIAASFATWSGLSYRYGKKDESIQQRLTKVEERTTAVEKKVVTLDSRIDGIECIDPEDCRKKQAEMAKLFQVQLDDGNRRFNEIMAAVRDTNNIIRENALVSEQRHQMLVSQLLRGGQHNADDR
jgi:hypothetical protein